MHEVHLWRTALTIPRPYGIEPALELLSITMRAVGAEHLDLGSQRHLLIEHLDCRRPVHDAAAERMLRLESDDEDGVARIARVVSQMVEDAPRFHHAGRGDDHHRSVPGIQRLGLAGLTSVADLRVMEEILYTVHEIFRGVEHFGVHRVNGGGVDGEWAVHVDGDYRYLPIAHEDVQVVHQLLRPANGEGRHEHLSPPFRRLGDDSCQLVAGSRHRRMVTIAVRRFEKNHVGAMRRLRVADDRQATPAHISGEDDALRHAVLRTVEHH